MKATEQRETGEKMHVYEIGYLVVPEVPAEKVADEAASIRALIEKGGGEIISEELPKMRNLSYPIAKEEQAYFGWIKFEVLVSEISKIESQLKQAKNILRYLVLKTIRENTMFSPRIQEVPAGGPKEVSAKDDQSVPKKVEKKVVSEEEIDKSIDALVIS